MVKRLFAAIFASVCLLCTANAADGTIQNTEYPGDVEAQAAMLHTLGLFRGTEQGFELERAMTRDEAAVMLVRYLGAEEKVLAGQWAHPFHDVPDWADAYVGWLYESGLTRGVSKTRYGAAQPITCKEFSVFLSRACSEGDDTSEIATDAEITACDAAGFRRADAVTLSTRALSAYYIKNDNFMTMAQFLIDKDVFTVDMLKNAAWDVLPRVYTDKPVEGLSDERYSPVCEIAGVTVARNPNENLFVIYSEPNTVNQIYAQSRITEPDLARLYTLDPDTLQETLVYEDQKPSKYTSFSILKCVGNTDYLLMEDDRIIGYDGKTVQIYPFKKQTGDFRKGNFYEEGMVAVQYADSAFIADETGAHIISLPKDTNIYTLLQGRLIAQQIGLASTTLYCMDRDGAVLEQYTVLNDDTSGLNQEPVGLMYAPSLQSHNSEYLWGEAGFYQIASGHMKQITTRATLDYGFHSTDNSYVIITHQPGKRVTYSESAVMLFGGDMLVRLHADGKEEVLLSDTPAHGMILGSVLDAGDTVRFTHLVPTEPRRMDAYTNILKDGKVQVLEADQGIRMMFGENALQAEQKRLKALGVGV